MKKRSGYLFQRASRWYLRTVIDGKPLARSLGTTSRREAEKRRAEIMRPIELQNKADTLRHIADELASVENQITELNKTITPVKTAWTLYVRSSKRPDSGAATLERYSSIWTRFEKWAIHHGIDSLEAVTEKHATNYVDSLTAEGFAPSTFNQHRNFLVLIWRILIPRNENHWRTFQTKRLQPTATRRKSLTPAQFESVLQVAEFDPEPELKDLLIILASTGLRLADAALLKWGAIDFRNSVITVTPIKTARRTGKTVFVPMFAAVIETLNRRQAGKVLDPDGYVFPRTATKYNRSRDSVSKQITNIFEKSGLQTSAERTGRVRRIPQYGAHSLRHFFVSQASAAGLPNAIVQSITGHATGQMLSHYQQLDKNITAELAARIAGGTAATADATATRIVDTLNHALELLAKTGQHLDAVEHVKNALLAIQKKSEKKVII